VRQSAVLHSSLDRPEAQPEVSTANATNVDTRLPILKNFVACIVCPRLKINNTSNPSWHSFRVVFTDSAPPRSTSAGKLTHGYTLSAITAFSLITCPAEQNPVSRTRSCQGNSSSEGCSLNKSAWKSYSFTLLIIDCLLQYIVYHSFYYLLGNISRIYLHAN